MGQRGDTVRSIDSLIEVEEALLVVTQVVFDNEVVIAANRDLYERALSASTDFAKVVADSNLADARGRQVALDELTDIRDEWLRRLKRFNLKVEAALRTGAMKARI